MLWVVELVVVVVRIEGEGGLGTPLKNRVAHGLALKRRSLCAMYRVIWASRVC